MNINSVSDSALRYKSPMFEGIFLNLNNSGVCADYIYFY